MNDQEQVVAELRNLVAELPEQQRDFVEREAANFRKMIAANPLYSVALALVGAEIAAHAE
jgi:methyl coenzyme M reductase subunit C-like uncharacterized protein (methanogenesis marker protein 7)